MKVLVCFDSTYAYYLIVKSLIVLVGIMKSFLSDTEINYFSFVEYGLSFRLFL